MVASSMASSSRTITWRASVARSWVMPRPSFARSFSRSLPGVGPNRTLASTRPRPSGRYQIGDDHERSWMVVGTLASQQAAKVEGTRGGAVRERRRPRALLDGLRDPRVAAGREGRRNRRGVAAVDAVRVADVRAPAAARVLEHAGVVEGALGGLELGVRPGGAERVGTRSAGPRSEEDTA